MKDVKIEHSFAEGQKGAIAAGNYYTALAGKQIFEAGGNAFDAIIAALAASFISETCMSSLGGGGFATISTKEDTSVLDFFCDTPNRSSLFQTKLLKPFEIDFGGTIDVFYGGFASVAIPGMVAGLFDIHKKYCSIPLSELFLPAIQMARKGVLIDDFQAYDFEILQHNFHSDKIAKAAYFPNGALIKKGQRQKHSEQADFLEVLAIEGKGLFYKGEISAIVSKLAKEENIDFERSNFENFQNKQKAPLSLWEGNSELYINPSLGGLRTQLASEEYNKIDSGSFNHKIVSALFNSQELFDEKVKKILSPIKKNGTSHMSACDCLGNSISLTVSNGEGSGVFIPNTGIQLNNMLGEPALFLNGLDAWEANTRVSSMMSPSILKTQESTFAIGTGGSARIPQTIFQTALHLTDHWSMIESIERSKCYFDGNIMQLEKGFEFKSNGFETNIWSKQDMYFGGINMTQFKKGSVFAAADGRRCGVSMAV